MSKCTQAKLVLVSMLCISLALAAQAAAPPPARDLITAPVDLARLHTLAGNTRGEANPQNDRGKVPDTLVLDHMLLQLQRSPERQQALENLLNAQLDKSSPSFHKWLTAQEFGRVFGPSQGDIDRVCAWLRASGFTVNLVYPSRTTIDFSGTAGIVATALHTEIHNLSVNGQDHIANMSDPRIPEALAPVVAGVVSLHDFRPHSMRRPRVQYSASGGGYDFQLIAPADLATIYDLNAAFQAGYTGQGQTIAVLEDSDIYSEQDWVSFRRVLGLSGYTTGTFLAVNPFPASGATNCTDPGGFGEGEFEATLDVEWASAAAPGATIWAAICADTDTTSGIVLAEQNILNLATPPQVVSISYGECEVANGVAANVAANSAAQQAAAQGISVFVAAGDEGAASCDAGMYAATHGIGVSGYASPPDSVAVGGTDFADMSQGTTDQYWSSSNSATYGSALSYVPEIPWNDSCAGAVLAEYSQFAVGYGADGYCDSALAQSNSNLTVGAGSGGPSGCASGVSDMNFVVGGTCRGYAKQAWQTGAPGNPSDGVRDLPDVSLFAGDGVWSHYYVVCFSDFSNGGSPCDGEPVNWSGAGGTSFASPIMAGFQALINQKMNGAQGNPNPVYYSLASGSAASEVFHTIATGDISVNCSGQINCFGAGFVGRGRSTPTTFFVGNGALSTSSDTYTPAFATGAGWNFATGLGSVDVYNLIMNWSAAK